MDRKAGNRISLRVKLILVVLMISMILGAVVICISYWVYANTMDRHYETLTVNLAKTAATQINGDKINQYADTLQKDAEYGIMLENLCDIQENNDVLCVYVLQMQDDGIMTIMDTDPEMDLGIIDPVADEFKGIPDDPGYTVYISDTDYGWLCSSALNLYDSDGNIVGMMCVDISMDEVMNDRYAFLRLVIFAVVLTVLAICAVLVYLAGRFVVEPINQLAKAAGNYVSGRIAGTELEKLESSKKASGQLQTKESAITRLNIHTGDEIEALADAFKTMEIEMEEYIENLTSVTAEKERIGAELNVATQIQASMLPSIFPAFPTREEFDIYATMDPAKEVGGDFYDFFLVDEDHLAFVIADVSGKGVPAALFMVIAKTLIKNHTQTGKGPAEVLVETNNQLCENNDAGMFVTGWIGILEISSGKLIFANAGHNPPLLKRANGEFEYLRTRPGLVLAAMEGMMYQSFELQLEKGDMLYLYTDGVTEATDVQSELYGENRLKSVLDLNSDKSPKELLLAVKGDIDRFVGEAPQFDDITMLCVKIGGKS